MHQASIKGVGCDCLGLLRGCWRSLCGQEPEAIPTYGADWSEPQGEEWLWQAAQRVLSPAQTNEPAAGDILLFRMRDGSVAKHLGILAAPNPTPTFVHAYMGHGVVESPLSRPWRKRIVARFRLREGL